MLPGVSGDTQTAGGGGGEEQHEGGTPQAAPELRGMAAGV